MRLITGMHRSGTSLVARLLSEAGVDFGHPSGFYPGDKWNPDGYFERREVHAINMPLINGPWGRLAYFFPPSLDTIMRRSQPMSDRITLVAENCRNITIKECRFCLTLPAWVAHGAQVDSLVVCLRDPIQVARSIRRRNKVPISIGLRLWLLHNQRLEKYTKGSPVHYVYYANLLDPLSFPREATALLHFMDRAWDKQGIDCLRDECIKPRMNHHPEQSYRYDPKVEEMWQRLKARYDSQWAENDKGH